MTPNKSRLTQDLIRIHKVITRSLKVGLSKGDEYLETGISHPGELLGFSRYIHCFTAVLDAHHNGEDLIAFPAFRKVLPLVPYDRLAVDHHEVGRQLAKLPPAIQNLSDNNLKEGLSVIVDTLKHISEVWYPHIRVEEQNFSEDKLNAVLTYEEQQTINEAAAKHSQEHSQPPAWVVPFVLFNLEQEDRNQMAANFPPMIANELVPIVWKDQWAPMKPFLLE
jgi:hemerythrin-like domain-containing protein